MSVGSPGKVLIAGGKTAGGVSSFAEALRQGFATLGLLVEVASPADILKRPGELRDPAVLKILSLASIFAAPIARRAFCLAHGLPCVLYQGWPTALALWTALRLAAASSGTQLVTVSDYSAIHLRAVFGLRVDGTIRNPMLPLFVEPGPETVAARMAVTFVGSLHHGKNIHRLLPAMRDVLNENAGLRAWIVGAGSMREELERISGGDERIEFLGELNALEVRERLRRSRVFISGCPHEAFGIAFLEALSQGCAVAMPASGGGLEIAPELIGNRIQLFSPAATRETVSAALRRALVAAPRMAQLAAYTACAVAQEYLHADARFTAQGIFHAEAYA